MHKRSHQQFSVPSFLWLCFFIAALIAFLRPAAASDHPPAGGRISGAAALEEIRCMTFNVRYGTAEDGENHWMLRRGLVMETIRGNAPDILCLQEALAWQIDLVRDSVPGFGAVAVGRDNGLDAGEHCAILYNNGRFLVAESGTFWFSDTPERPASKSWGNNVTRICTWVRLVDRKADRAFYVYNVHLDHESQNSREQSARLLADRIARRPYPDPVIVTGDFNAGEGNKAVDMLIAKGGVPDGGDSFPLLDTFRFLHPNATDVGTYHAFTGDRKGEKIDFILVSRDWTILSSEIDRFGRNGKYPSDHFPVTARIF